MRRSPHSRSSMARRFPRRRCDVPRSPARPTRCKSPAHQGHRLDGREPDRPFVVHGVQRILHMPVRLAAWPDERARHAARHHRQGYPGGGSARPLRRFRRHAPVDTPDRTALVDNPLAIPGAGRFQLYYARRRPLMAAFDRKAVAAIDSAVSTRPWPLSRQKFGMSTEGQWIGRLDQKAFAGRPCPRGDGGLEDGQRAVESAQVIDGCAHLKMLEARARP